MTVDLQAQCYLLVAPKHESGQMPLGAIEGNTDAPKVRRIGKAI
ncbi:hypothetical protein HMPREF1487_08531 [Pseudomonas sp. HPB0071]|uniref:Uncharacterized protein n=2 Tax=Pseudomonas TaxID=286 RepID=A0A2X2D253_PSELU|nr:hypothetical protein HMPREF1487_08531 [Pseudomonas sp. HPB0071]SER28676.1 hypothetical protein SAMN05216409_1168 [Pseudomonas lutea]SHJ74420.1 hypothetical protein SAMN05216295_1279 [Pseudomonas zeshuii]SPZ13404.1 Uncharacterised protein [Pseudomonas luteola]